MNQLHHVNCVVCIAAGKEFGQRCETGQALLQGYEKAWAWGLITLNTHSGPQDHDTDPTL